MAPFCMGVQPVTIFLMMTLKCPSQLIRAMDKAYVISVHSVEDIKNLYKSLGLVRSLLMVQVGPDEEELLKTSIWLASQLLRNI